MQPDGRNAGRWTKVPGPAGPNCTATAREALGQEIVELAALAHVSHQALDLVQALRRTVQRLEQGTVLRS